MARLSVWHLGRYGFRPRLLALDLTSRCLEADAPQGSHRVVSPACRGCVGGRGGDALRLGRQTETSLHSSDSTPWRHVSIHILKIPSTGPGPRKRFRTRSLSGSRSRAGTSSDAATRTPDTLARKTMPPQPCLRPGAGPLRRWQRLCRCGFRAASRPRSTGRAAPSA